MVLVDLDLEGAREAALGAWPDRPWVGYCRRPGADLVLEALRAGAVDVVRIPDELDRFADAVGRGVRRRRLREELVRLRRTLDRTRFEELMGESAPMRRLFRLLDRVAASDASTLITGETGTGKELVARAIHRRSRRKDGPFVAINCAAVPETLLESELFGHVKGAFTDARQSRRGLFLRADKGTLLLDEIGDMPRGLQAKVLRALETRRVRPVGGDEEVAFDVRVIAATHANVEHHVETGAFRQDLYFRLAVLQVELPPLRDRGHDIVDLAHVFLERVAAAAGRPGPTLTPEAAARMLEYRWPGNVRELLNACEHAIALAEGDLVTLDDLPARIRLFKPSHVLVAAERPSELVTLEEVERRYIRRVLAATDGNRVKAARLLGLDRKTLYRKLKRYAIEDGSADG